MANDGTNFDAAFEIYATMQRNGVEPDDLLYGHLIALAGRCRKLEVRRAVELSLAKTADGLACQQWFRCNAFLLAYLAV